MSLLQRLSYAIGITTLTISAFSHAGDTYMCLPADIDGELTKQSEEHVRFATFNAFLNRFNQGDLINDLQDPTQPQIAAVAEIIQRTRPDVLLLNEFDYDAAGIAVSLFQQNYLSVGQNGQQPIEYPYVFLAESNTGIPSGLDFNNDGITNGPDDAYGFGFFPGQFAMVLLSRHPIDERRARTFQKFLWKDMPGALLPDDELTPRPGDYYNKAELAVFRLSSKSHWDIPIWIHGKKVHVLAAHPTPPVFDGTEDRNGRRNHDEIRFWADYVGGHRKSRYIYDDEGKRGGLDHDDAFVILGDYNADPLDGDSTNSAILQLLEHPKINGGIAPASIGGIEDSTLEGQTNAGHISNPALDTGDFNPADPGNLRVDYVLPSNHGIQPVCGGIFWPATADTTRSLVGDGFPVVSSDHHLVWMDMKLTGHKHHY